MFTTQTTRHIFTAFGALECSANVVDLRERVEAAAGEVLPWFRCVTGQGKLT